MAYTVSDETKKVLLRDFPILNEEIKKWEFIDDSIRLSTNTDVIRLSMILSRVDEVKDMIERMFDDNVMDNNEEFNLYLHWGLTESGKNRVTARVEFVDEEDSIKTGNSLMEIKEWITFFVMFNSAEMMEFNALVEIFDRLYAEYDILVASMQ